MGQTDEFAASLLIVRQTANFKFTSLSGRTKVCCLKHAQLSARKCLSKLLLSMNLAPSDALSYNYIILCFYFVIPS